jgi:hypothetical protein
MDPTPENAPGEHGQIRIVCFGRSIVRHAAIRCFGSCALWAPSVEFAVESALAVLSTVADTNTAIAAFRMREM